MLKIFLFFLVLCLVLFHFVVKAKTRADSMFQQVVSGQLKDYSLCKTMVLLGKEMVKVDSDSALHVWQSVTEEGSLQLSGPNKN